MATKKKKKEKKLRQHSLFSPTDSNATNSIVSMAIGKLNERNEWSVFAEIFSFGMNSVHATANHSIIQNPDAHTTRKHTNRPTDRPMMASIHRTNKTIVQSE